ncbi:Smr/MutS family protein [Lentiprolixibacter aurantiacus]|uniref:DNA mismatch repair protein MutS n=1 Tax=Lentiprolixibacter aurantiacus TaxID=2993939 RepID=A0AAE3MNC5_9FLAO|nr:Smr/MutS family protein [Lentiprolixibacter aurantiacus]MCX2720037.1 DNA mismatch repair protein MutS [Lentiprolixibacter aurantiacus]
MMRFEPGDRVETLDDVLTGRVTAVEGDQVTIETESGFPMVLPASALIKIPGKDVIRVSNHEAAMVKRVKEEIQDKKKITPKAKDRNAPKMEVDLHIHQLVPSTKGMSNYDMLNLQLETAKRQLEFAMRKRIQKVVFIHGKGAGVLEEELKYLFGRYDNVKHYDADYRKYGLGATEVYIFQNPK